MKKVFLCLAALVVIPAALFAVFCGALKWMVYHEA